MLNVGLIVIDYTNDFVADWGSLTCGIPGQEIEDYIIEKIEEFDSRGDYVLHAVDVHKPNDEFHPETKLFPTHNVRGTEGRELFGDVKEVSDRLGIEVMDKTRYSAFAGTDLEMRLIERRIEEIHLVGVCTDICVLHTAIDAYNKGFKVVVHEKGVASFDPVGHEWALGHFKNTLGFRVV